MHIVIMLSQIGIHTSWGFTINISIHDVIYVDLFVINLFLFIEFIHSCIKTSLYKKENLFSQVLDKFRSTRGVIGILSQMK